MLENDVELLPIAKHLSPGERILTLMLQKREIKERAGLGWNHGTLLERPDKVAACHCIAA